MQYKEEIEKNLYDEDSLNRLYKQYKEELEKYDVLSEEQQQELIRKYRYENDIESFNKLFNHNMRLSVFVAKKYKDKCSSMTFMDLVQENNIILMKALELYDPNNKKAKLSTYIVTAMEYAIKQQIDNKDNMIRKPIQIEILLNSYRNLIDKYYEINRNFPSDEYIKQQLKITQNKLNELKNCARLKTRSLNEKINNDDDETELELESTIETEEEGYTKFENYIDLQVTKKALSELLDKREYIYVYYKDIISKPISYLILTNEFDISRQAIDQKYKKALNILRRRYNSKRKEVLQTYSINELEEMELDPLLPSTICLYHSLKEKMDDLSYSIIYTKNINRKNYNLEYFKKKFPYCSESSIIEKIESIQELEKDIFQKENIQDNFNKYKEKYKTKEILELYIKPDKNPLEEQRKQADKLQKEKEQQELIKQQKQAEKEKMKLLRKQIMGEL
mgnify:CR=1 FL=1